MFKTNNQINVVGVSSDLGANIPGTRLGPDAIRIAGLHRLLQKLNLEATDQLNLTVPLRKHGTDGSYNYLKEITQLSKAIYQKTKEALDRNSFPLTLGGDHSISIGTVAASAEKYSKLGLIWIDTHADLNTPISSPTQNIHGMPVSTLLHQGYPELVNIVKQKLKAEHIAMIGLRDIDNEERILLAESGIIYHTMRDVDEKGITNVFNDIKRKLIDKVDHLHVSFDLDVMDPIYAPGVSTAVNGGLNTREAHLILEMLHETQKVVAFDFVELNPMNDVKGKSARLCIDLIGSLLGTSIM